MTNEDIYGGKNCIMYLRKFIFKIFRNTRSQISATVSVIRFFVEDCFLKHTLENVAFGLNLPETVRDIDAFQGRTVYRFFTAAT